MNAGYTSNKCKCGCRLASSAAASHSVDMEREFSPELMELREALLKLRAGRHCEIDIIRLLELFERLHDKRQDYWATIAAAIATQAARPEP